MSILDDYPFPFDKLEGQELMRVLANLYRTETEAILLTQPFGVDPLDVPSGLAPRNLWFQLLQMLAAQGNVRATVQVVRDRTPNNPRTPFLDALLKDKLAPVSAEPVPPPGASADFDDSVTEPEALLFFDDLTMPVGRVPNLLATLGGLLECASAVCLLRVENAFGQFFGTGFRIGPKLILTNHHVLYPKSVVATRVQADFGFDVDAMGASIPVTSLAGTPSSIRGERPDDWAVVEVGDLDARWATLPLAAEPVPNVGEAAYILQHPGGQQKRLGFVRNTISDVTEGVVRYLTDTEPGSSGAPVFDAQCRLIALHHAGGTPVEVAGKPPVSKNEGIRISRVLARLQAAGIQV
ncbi:trypsin-like peptidase domain-containing protein [Cupriavidus sp. L7L]|uniref:trypsin-like peptidase domain-containing protein n=1 Tax=Cupriavidus sp. L7L TaxID=2546443 RepID=UPI001055E925|nr:trypsin-like peptidase domain-containing protein [Cupriavidus sp. L7L]TDF56777.1 serine protease [Cupriavidus sp. L7L]